MEAKTVGGVPVECLMGELGAVWSGWRTLGDREVVREASAKGTHINLAQKCLACRRNCSISEAKSYFYKEVDIWVNELLKEQQVHKASHILQNVDKSPKQYISEICTKCTEPRLRNYLVQHLIKINGFEEVYTEAWNIINFIAEYETKYALKDRPLSNTSIEEIRHTSENTILALYAELYFHVCQQEICDKLCSDVVWDYLLFNNRIDLIRSWISVNYAPKDIETDELQKGVIAETRKVFAGLKITQEMIDSVENSHATATIKDETLNFLCRYGVFATKEQFNVKLILSRFFKNCILPTTFDKILSHESCNINKRDFMSKLDIQLYSRSYLEDNKKQESDISNEKLSNALKDMCSARSLYQSALKKGILETINYISPNPLEFLAENYLVTFILISLQCGDELDTGNTDFKRKSLEEIVKDDCDFKIDTIEIPKEIISNMLNHLPHLKQVIENDATTSDMTMYQLLNGYKNLNVSQVFQWRQKNGIVPSFSNKNLSKKYGYRKKLSYVYYLKEGRPNMAVIVLKREQEALHGCISTKMRSQAALVAHTFGLKNLSNPEILSSCISFIEILGVDSINLRLHITVADYIRDKLNIYIENLLVAAMSSKDQTDVRSVLSYLEHSFNLCMTTSWVNDIEKFLSDLKTWDVVLQFARVHNVSLPDSLLKFLARNNFWFEFVLVGHIFAYPIDQILESAKHFDNQSMKEHLLISLNNSQLTEKSSSYITSKFKSRDTRRCLYSKIGFKQNESPEPSPPAAMMMRNMDTCSTTKSETSSCGSVDLNATISSSINDQWWTILRCHQSQDPPGTLLNASRLHMSPLLTVLATCYEPSSTAAYWCSWLVISVQSEEFIAKYQECMEQQVWPAGKVLELIQNVVSLGYVDSLSRSLQIFMPTSPLCPFADFLVRCINLGDYATGESSLINFKSQNATLKCNKMINWNSTDMSYLINAYWIAVVAVKCVIVTLGQRFQSTSLQIKFLKVLTKCDFQVDLPVHSPDFHSLLKFTKILSRTDETLNFSNVDITENECNFDIEIKTCINNLVKNENYDSALQLSLAAHMECSEIIIAQNRSFFKRSIDEDGKVELSFWKRCATDFERYNVCREKATEFFVAHVEKVVSHKERYEILKLALQVLKKSITDRQIVDTLEMAMWKSCILAGPENVELESNKSIFNKLKTELLSGLNTLEVTCKLTEETEKKAVETLINRLLDGCQLEIALRISNIFQFKHRDLQVLMLCLSLAEGEVLPYELTAQQRILLSKIDDTSHPKHGTFLNRGSQRLSSSSSLNTCTSSINAIGSSEEIEPDVASSESRVQVDCILLLEKLLETLQHGLDIAKRVIICYRLGIHLRRSYQTLLTLNDPMKFLQEVVEKNYNHKLEIVSDIVTAYRITNQEVADFLADKVIKNITVLVQGEADQLMAIWGYPLDANFHLIIELCNEPSLLGLKLLEGASTLLGRSQGFKRNVPTLKIIVELLIRAHDCFTASCNMEGIASVLRKCQYLANSLQNLKQWGLLVRLLTGVSRFTEMNYIFQILKDNDQFESLLKRGLNKVPGLKMALLEFLKRQCPENRDLFTLVALHFQLYYEIALMWEEKAKAAIVDLINKAKNEMRNIAHSQPTDVTLVKNENTEKKLQLSVTDFTHATQYYIQDNRLNLAWRCSHQAQLVALQISLFSGVQYNQRVMCILNLNNTEIDRIICQTLSFSQALILVRAYNHHADWASAIYTHCIVNGETKYLKELSTSRIITTTIVRDCAKRYKLEKSITKQMAENMQMLVSQLSDIECKYTLASQFGFKKILEGMLGNSFISSYLKDTVWRQGYNTSGFM